MSLARKSFYTHVRVPPPDNTHTAGTQATTSPLRPLTMAESGPECEDTVGWENNRGKTCRDYADWCDGGAFRQGSEWAAGEARQTH